MALHKGIVPSGTEIRTTTVRDEVPLDEIGLKRKKSMTEGATESRRGSRVSFPCKILPLIKFDQFLNG